MGYPQEVSICSKYFLFLCNTVFWVLSIILLTIGGWAWWAKGFFENLDQLAGIPIDPVLLIVGIGVTMFVVSFTGCLGALRENIMLLKFFSGVLGIIFFGQLVIGILSFIYKDWFTRKVEEIVMHTIVSYRDDPDLQNIIDLTQSSLECCGISEPGDWEKNIYFNCSATVQVNGIEYKPAEHCGVPFSCCKPELIEVNGTEVKDVANTQCGYGRGLENILPNEIFKDSMPLSEYFPGHPIPSTASWPRATSTTRSTPTAASTSSRTGCPGTSTPWPGPLSASPCSRLSRFAWLKASSKISRPSKRRGLSTAAGRIID